MEESNSERDKIVRELIHKLEKGEIEPHTMKGWPSIKKMENGLLQLVEAIEKNPADRAAIIERYRALHGKEKQ